MSESDCCAFPSEGQNTLRKMSKQACSQCQSCGSSSNKERLSLKRMSPAELKTFIRSTFSLFLFIKLLGVSCQLPMISCLFDACQLALSFLSHIARDLSAHIPSNVYVPTLQGQEIPSAVTRKLRVWEFSPCPLIWCPQADLSEVQESMIEISHQVPRSQGQPGALFRFLKKLIWNISIFLKSKRKQLSCATVMVKNLFCFVPNLYRTFFSFSFSFLNVRFSHRMEMSKFRSALVKIFLFKCCQVIFFLEEGIER